MNKYAECVEYLISLGFPKELSESVCRKFETNKDYEGLLNYLLLCEAMVASYVD